MVENNGKIETQIPITDKDSQEIIVDIVMEGKSAYDMAVEKGFDGTLEEWLLSLHGKDGKDADVDGIQAQFDTVGARLDSTDAQLNNMTQDFTQHELDYEEHKEDYNTLESEFTQHKEDYNTLESEFTQHKEDYNTLESEFTQHKEDYEEQRVLDLQEIESKRQQDQLKVAKVEKDINDYQQVMSQVNVNQEAKQGVSGYGVVSLPKNSASGHVGVSVKGRTLKNELNYNRDTWAEWSKSQGVVADSTGIELIKIDTTDTNISIPTKIKPSTQYGVLYNVTYTTLTGAFGLDGSTFEYPILFQAVGNNKGVFTSKNSISSNRFYIYFQSPTEEIGNKIKLKEIRMFELPTGSEIEADFNTMTADQLAQKYPYINGDGTKSTISASRLKSVGKNLFDKTQITAIGRGLNIANGMIDLYTNQQASLFIEVKPLTTYRRTSGEDSQYKYALYDANKNFISGGQSTTINTPANCKYLRIGWDTALDVNTIMVNEGATLLPYEPYTESTQYLPNVGELRSLPKGVKDEIRMSGGKAEHIKRVSDEVVLDGNLYWNDVVDLGATIRVYADIITDATNSHNTPSSCTILTTAVEGDNIDIEGHWVAGIYNRIGLKINKSRLTTIDIDGVKAWLNANPLTLTYQLAEPIITPIDVSGTLLSNPSGTVYVEHGTYAVGLYGENGITVTETELPIKTMNKITKIDYETGLEHELDVSKAIVSEDGLLFTHEDLEAGDIVFFDYDYSVESTQGETTIEYYDSRYVIEDTENGKFYQWKISATNGTPSIELVEV